MVRRSLAAAISATLVTAVASIVVVSAPSAGATVPPPPANGSVITVKTAGDRVGVTGVTPLAGVTLGLFDTATATTPVAGFGTCTSDADGDCSFIVPGTQPSGANRDRQFFVKQIGAPSGWFTNPALGTGTTVASDPYVFQTGTQLRSGVTYTSTEDFMIGTGNTNNEASGGFWQDSRTDPTLPARCGLKVALVTDLSNSVGADLVNLKSAATTFVNALVGTPSTVSLFTFATNAPADGANNVNRPALNPVSTQAGANVVNGYINGLTLPGGNNGGTNWDRGFAAVAQATETYDVTVIITDGSPTFYNQPVQGPGNRTRFREVENGIFSANQIKSEGTRVIAFGVGSGVASAAAGLNLRAISGPVLGSDYYQTTDYAAAGAALRALALGSCVGSITVVKQVIPPGGTTAQATPAGGWTFGATANSGIGVTPASGQTATGTGALNFALTFPGGTTTGNATLTETQQAGYTLVQQAGLNAACTRIDTGAALPVTNSGALGFTVGVASVYPVTCTVYNQAPSPPATVVVNKTWIVNGVSFPNGSQDPRFVAALTLNGTAQDWGLVRTGFLQGANVVVNETTTLTNAPLCTITSRQVTNANGTTIAAALPYTATLNAGANSYMITNTVTCQTQLRLVKDVQGGAASPTLWTLTAIAPTGSISGPFGPTGVTGPVTPDSTYALAESGGDARYIQNDTRVTPVPGSSGSWNCVEIDPTTGAVIPGYQDGINGGVTVPIGYLVRCTATNQTAFLTLAKQVVNANGSAGDPSQWTLTATPLPPVPPGLPPTLSVPGSAAGVRAQVRPLQQYSLSETGPAGYAASAWSCTSDVTRSANTITLVRSGEATCTITNTAIPPKLTLKKVVDNGATGGTAVPADWTLTAVNGASTISGPGNSPQVTNQTANVGTYALRETGPTGYTGSAWTCTGGASSTATSVTLVPGSNATCTVTNTALAPRLTLTKVVDNGATGATAVPPDWTLTAVNGASTISGPGNTPPVTNQTALAGTYTLSESGGPTGYTASAWVCTGGVSATGSSVTLAPGSVATCTITNTAVAPKLTLVKVVTNTFGGQAVATDWTLTAINGTSTISGVTGTPAVTGATAVVGTYTLSESGPAGYAGSAWVCTGGASTTGSTVTLGLGSTATCTITNTDIEPNLTLRKVVDPAASGSGKTPADWTLTATPVNIPGQGTVSGNGADGVTNVPVFAGAYVLTESGPPGFTPGTWVCQGGVFAGGQVTVPSGGTVLCTITNTAITPRLTLVKTVDNGTSGGTAVPTDWTLTASGPTPISGPSGSPPVTNAPVEVGTYTLAESGGPAGYTPSDWTCTGATFTPTSVAVVEGTDATCTINNTAIVPKLTLVKVVDNGATGGTAVPSDWTLTAVNGTSTISGPGNSAGVTDQDAIVGSYALSETGPPDYTASAWVCTGGATTTGDSVTLALGSNATCTITNTAQPAHLTLVKTVDNGTGAGTAVPTDWTLTGAGPLTISGVTGSADVTGAPVPVGSYTLTEAGPAGYTASTWTCTGGGTTTSPVTVGLGQDVTCTITNTAIAPRLTLVKQVSNTHGGTAVPTDWTLTGAGPATVSGVTGSADVTDAVVQVGSYALSEAGPAGYSASAWTCTGGAAATDSSVTLASGDSATCTIVNSDVPAHLTLRKIVDAAATGSGKVPADWTLTATPVNIPGQGVVSGNGDPNSPGGVNQRPVDVGSYALSETGPVGFDAGDWICQGGVLTDATVAIPTGGTVICTITNTARTPRLTLVKTVDNGNTGATTTAQAWTLKAAGPTPISGITGSAPVTDAAVAVGGYTLSEAGPAGYLASAWTCTGAVAIKGVVALVEGSNATCRITNTAVTPHLTLVKQVHNRYGGTADATAWTLHAAGPSSIAGVTGAATVTDAAVRVGSYTLSESDGPSGYTASAWTCTGATPSAGSVTLAVGAVVVCTIVNSDEQPPPPIPPEPPITPPFTGGPSPWLLWTGLTLLIVGGVVTVLARRRRTS